MTKRRSRELSLGELIELALAQARAITTDTQQAARIASRTVSRWLARSNRQDLARRLARAA